MNLTSFNAPYRAAVFGASGGIGASFIRTLSEDPNCAALYAGSRSPPHASLTEKIKSFPFDLTDEPSIAAAAAQINADGPVDLILVATGFLHDETHQPEKTLRALDGPAILHAYALNAVGPALIAKHMLPHLPKDRKSVFGVLSARVGSISDNRTGGWHAYRASKAALNMLVRSFAIEVHLRNKQAICVALHPGTVDTPLSQPFQAAVAKDKLFTPEQSARALLTVVDGLTPDQSGQLFAWDGQTIPF
jgi:NAD(P)-dependent dehydrogenase (short-subunit alcohol dehydrogenase family)